MTFFRYCYRVAEDNFTLQILLSGHLVIICFYIWLWISLLGFIISPVFKDLITIEGNTGNRANWDLAELTLSRYCKIWGHSPLYGCYYGQWQPLASKLSWGQRPKCKNPYLWSKRKKCLHHLKVASGHNLGTKVSWIQSI